jgi:molybdopterin synthase catalytic subunit
MHSIDVRLLDATFSPEAALAAFAAVHPESGAIASFLGQVRGEGGDALELTHYAPLTLPGIEDLAQSAAARWPLHGVLIHHRIGRLAPGEPIVLVAAAARHRRAALEAVDFLMDHLKSAAWLWKRELREGQWHWIEPRPEDHVDRARW